MNTDFSEFEEKLGYVFKDKSLLETAFTHTTYVFEQGGGHWESNQRLEFIGDAVGDLVVGRMLYEMNPTGDEGYLSKMRSISVCERSFAEAARKLDMGSYLLLGKGEEQTGGRDKDSTLADCSRRQTALSLNQTLSTVTSAFRAAGQGEQGTFMGKVEYGRPFSARAR